MSDSLFLKSRDVATALGIHLQTARELIRSPEGPRATTIGKRRYVHRDHFADWIEARAEAPDAKVRDPE